MNNKRGDKMKVAINGFGRIGKQFFLAAMERRVNWDFIINSVPDPELAVYELKHDSVHKTPVERITHDGKHIYYGRKKIKFYAEKDPLHLPWAAEKVDLVVDCTGMFTDAEQARRHIIAGAKKVLISAPAKNHNATIVYGVNEEMLKPEHKVISAGSCTTNCVAPMVKILNDAFKIKNCYFVTTHAVTATQRLVDAIDEKDLRRGRSAMIDIIPSTSGASQSVVEAVPELKEKLEGYALRVPVADGSFASVIASIEKKATKDEINNIFRKASMSGYEEILEYTDEEIVSGDIIDNPSSCIFDAGITSTSRDGMMVSIGGWYDNEYGYACRLVDVAGLILSKK